MTAIKITNFSGIIPKLADRLLPDNAAQMAANTKLSSGELRPMRKARNVFTPASALSLRSMFKVDETTWFTWPTADVKMVQAAFLGEARFAYTGLGPPKITTKTLGTPVSGSGSPGSSRTLGIPAPKTAPTVTPTGGVGATVNRFYIYTFYSDANEESSGSPVSALVTGKVDDTWAITGMEASPPNTGSITAATHSTGVVTVTTSGNHFLRAGDEITITGVVGMTDLNGTFTVTEAPANNQYRVALTTAQSYTSGGTWTRLYPWGPCTKRLYRTAGTLAEFQLVAEGITGTTYNDTLTDAAIPGDGYITDDWAPPPADLAGMFVLPNGSLGGYSGNLLCITEPYQPHAWPVSYQRKATYQIKGAAALDNGNVVVATTGSPFIYSGFEPASAIMERIERPMPCLSSRSVCSVGEAAVFATRGGLALIGAGVPQLLTAQLFSDEDWYALNPESMRCAFTRGSLYLYSDTTPSQLFIIGISPEASGPVVTAPLVVDALHVDTTSGRIYYAFRQKVYEFDPDNGVPLVQNWWSKEFALPKPMNMGAAKVSFSSTYSKEAQAAFDLELQDTVAANNATIAAGRARGSINASAINAFDINGSDLLTLTLGEPSITFQLLINGTVVFGRQVASERPFRLPSGYKADSFSVRIMANTQVRSVEVGETMQGLQVV